MEGAGEGAVAILQGTKHAGLKVILASDNRLRLKRKCMLMDLGVRPPTRITQSSVETNTERVFKNSSDPVCDVRYAASYQFANSKCVQSSFRVPEFPQHSTFYRHSDQFANSLRKYPIEASSEVLQRIINYSNIKQNNRKQNLRKIRSLLRKSMSQHMNLRYDRGVNTNNKIYENKPLNKSISMIGRRYSSQKELLNYTYDYLRCMSLIPKCTDVRYLTQVKRCIRNRLLEIVDDRPAICPRIRSRYSHHKRHYHGPVSKPTLTCNENKIQESSGTTKFSHAACTNMSYSRRKSCFFHQPKKCNCKSKLYKQNPLESLLTKLYPELNVNKKEIPSKQIIIEPKIQASKDCTSKLLDDVDDKIMTAVSEWLKSIPVYPNFSANDKMKQKKMAFKLAENLSLLKNEIDFISKAKMEIISCVNDLSMWCPADLNEKEKFFDQMVTDLLKRLVNVLENEIKYKVAQVVSNLPYTADIDTEKIVNDFVNKINTIVLCPTMNDADYIKVLKPKILDLLNKLPIQCTLDDMHDVADELVNQLLELRLSKPHDEESMPMEVYRYRESILKWCKNAPELENIDFSQNTYLIDELVNKFKYYESRGPIDENVQAELIKTIRTWLEDAANTVNLRLNSKIKKKLSNKMAKYFFGKDYNNTLNKNRSSEDNTSEEALEPLLKWYDGIQELAGGKRIETRKVLDRLAKELKEIQSRDYNFENMLTDMKEVVTDCLQNMLIKQGKYLEPKVFDNCVNKLISELNNIPKRKKQRLSCEYGQFYRDIISWMKDISYLKTESRLNQDKVIEKLVNKLNNIHKVTNTESTINEAVKEFIRSLSESIEVFINERDVQILKDKLFDRLKQTFKQRKRWDKVNDLCQSTLIEISNILQKYSNILSDTKINNIKHKFYKNLKQNIEENDLPNWNYLLRRINNIFKEETQLSKNEYEDMANSIISSLQRMFSHEITRRSTILSQPVKAYTESAKIIENKFVAAKKHKSQKNGRRLESAYDKNKSKTACYRKLNPQAGDGRKYRKHSKMSTIFKSSNSDLDVHDSVDYYDNNYDVSEYQNDHSVVDGHEDFRTSTPLSAAINNFPSAPDVKSPIGNVIGDTKILLHDSEFSKQPQYFMKLKNIIMDWIKNIDLSIINFDLDDVIDGIASDIIDREKYLQLSEMKYSENDEIEHLKYQVFRRLNKLKKNDTLSQIMSKINSLYRVIKNINVPDLIKPGNESYKTTTSVSDNSIFNNISHWLHSVSSNLLKSTNIKHNPTLINKLVQNLEKNQCDYQMEKDILLWLRNILRNCNDKMFHELVSDLKSSLKDTLPKISYILKQDASKFIDENISDAVVAWLQTAPFYNICTSEDRYLQENLALLLATNLKNILQATNNESDNLNDLLMEEVLKYLKNIPIPTELRNNHFYYNAAGELVEYLKKSINKIKKLCDGINNIPTTSTETSPSDFNEYKELVKNIIHNWCDNLPIHLGHSPENKEEANKLKHKIAIRLLEKLYYHNLNEPNNDRAFEIILSDEIDIIFNNIPMNRELERSFPILKSILFEKLKQAKIQIQSLIPKKILQDTLTRTLQEIENTPDLERASLNLLKEKLADAFINLHYHASTDFEFRDKLKDKLYNEIKKFCNEYLQRYPYSPIDSDDLRFNLYAALKNVSIPDMQHIGISNESPKLSFEKDVTLKNATTQYSSPQFLPSSLSVEDRAHLEIIKKRAAGYPNTVNADKDLSPQIKEIGVQTDCKEIVEENVQTSKTLLAETINFSKEILPQVVIKEFYWDSSGSKQSLPMFVPPALTPHKIIPRKKEMTNDSQNQTESTVINNSTKVHISQKLPGTREVSSKKVDKASGATSPHNSEKHDHPADSCLNSPVLQSQTDQTLISRKDSIHSQKHTEKTFHQYQRKSDTSPDRVFDIGVNERYYIEPPRTFDDDRHFRNHRRHSNYLEDLVKIPDDRRLLNQRIYLTPENRNKENMCCDHNTSWRMAAGACRRRYNNTLKHCSKCCGGFCPHPTLAFFKKTF